MPLAFLFYEHGFEPRWGGAKLRERSAFSSKARKGHGSLWKRTGVTQRGLHRMRPRSKRGASVAAGLQVDEVFRTHIVIHRVGKFSTILRPALLALPHTHLLGTTGF